MALCQYTIELPGGIVQCAVCKDRMKPIEGRRIVRHCPGVPQAPGPPAEPVPTEGPGTELKTTLSAKGFPTCGRCAALAAEMDRRGPQWCRDNLDSLVGQVIANAALFKTDHDKRLAAHKSDPTKPEPKPLTWTAYLAFNLPEIAQRAAIKGLITEATERAEAKEREKVAAIQES